MISTISRTAFYIVLLHVIPLEARLPPNFAKGDFYPKKSTNDRQLSESRASGRIRDVIRRNTVRFRNVLVRNVNSEVAFETEDSRFMTSRAKSRLDILASRVLSTWNRNTNVRVLKSWTDAVDRDDLLSLHYEGELLDASLTFN